MSFLVKLFPSNLAVALYFQAPHFSCRIAAEKRENVRVAFFVLEKRIFVLHLTAGEQSREKF